ncbi:hypothetical protein [Bradyrhizobium sp.]|uniref:hypothetical protein n=1 Tax=Bradyrhizobium sp. TaxID=376 RepID=UPI0025C66C2C|nr:hypothetical protein [Bradyrhizobium sp.]
MSIALNAMQIRLVRRALWPIGGRLGFRIAKGWLADLFANGTLGPAPVGNTTAASGCA